MNIYQWEEAIMSALEGQDWASVDAEIKATDGSIYLVRPPGRVLVPGGNPAVGWSFGFKGEGASREYSSLRELLERCLDETWACVSWPREREVGSRVRLPASVHRNFKKKLLDVDLSIQEFYRRAVDRFLSEEDWLP